MGYDDCTPFEKANCDVARLLVSKTGVFHSYGVAFKYGGHIHEINGVFADVGLTFVFVPLEFHSLIAVTIHSRVYANPFYARLL